MAAEDVKPVSELASAVEDIQLVMAAEDVKPVSEPASAVEDDQVQNADMQEEDPVFTQLAQKMVAAAAEGQDVPVVDLLDRYMRMEARDWHNRIRRATLGLIAKVPMVGFAISGLVGLFWPSNKVDIWEAIKAEEKIRNIVQQEIFDFEMQLLRNDIEVLELNVQRYARGTVTEKGIYLGIWITRADALCIAMRNSTNNIHLLLHIVTVATLHLAALHERLTFGEELYGENNTAIWTQDLVDKFRMYTTDLIPNVFRRWKEWRETHIEIRAWVNRGSCGILNCRPDVSHATVEDKMSGARFTFYQANRNSTTIFSGICEDHKTRMMNEAIADMASCLSPTFAFHKLLPENIQGQFSAYDREQFGRVFRGPYSQDLLIGAFTTLKSFRSHPTRFDQTARDRVVAVVVRAGQLVDALQFWYDHVTPTSVTLGTMAGHSSGGAMHVLNARDNPMQELRMGFAADVLVSLQLHFEDGTATQNFGSPGWASRTATCTAPDGYRFSSWAFREDTGPYGTPAISVLRFQFTPELDIPLP